MGSRWTLLATLALGCASVPGRPPAPRLTPVQQKALAQAERLYRARDPAFAARRDELAGEPATAYWLAGMLIRDVLWSRGQRRANVNALFNLALRRADPVETHAKQELRALGAAAVPCLVDRLLRSGHGDLRELGSELIAAVGPAAIEALSPALRSGDVHLRLHAVQAVAAMAATPATREALTPFAEDADFTVRVAALRGLAKAGASSVALLRSALQKDGDPFVRRTVVSLLADFGDRKTAEAVVAYLGRALQEGDVRGAQAADMTLRKIAGRKRAMSLEGWQAWLAGFSGGPGVDEGGPRK